MDVGHGGGEEGGNVDRVEEFSRAWVGKIAEREAEFGLREGGGWWCWVRLVDGGGGGGAVWEGFGERGCRRGGRFVADGHGCVR